ncbi:MAG: hypothetical protein M3096_06510 [Actinomycetia bacterium]|nr:hypothetical protein [Actinomycetes bacterium]
MRRYIVGLAALILLIAACGGDGSTEDLSGSDTGSEITETDSADSDSGGGESGSTGSENESTSDGTQIFVASTDGIDIVDLDAETQEVFVEGYGNPYGLIVAQDDLWFADAQNSLASVDARSREEKGTVALPGQFAGLSVTEDAAWVIAGLIGLDSQLVGVERDGMTIRGTALPPQGTYYDLVAGSGGDVWVHGGDIESSTTVGKVDPVMVTVGDRVDSGVIADSMVIGLGALWIGGTKAGSPDGSTVPVSAIAKLDPATGDVLDLLEIGGSGDDEVVVEVAFDHLWATQGLEAVLIKFDAASGDEVGRVDVGSGAAGIPYPILLTSDAIWVVNSTDSQALSFNPDTLDFVSGITLPYFAGTFAFVP